MKVKSLAARIQKEILQPPAAPDLPTLTKQLVKEIRRLSDVKNSDPSWSKADQEQLEELDRLYDKVREVEWRNRRRNKARNQLPDPPDAPPLTPLSEVGDRLNPGGFEISTNQDLNESIRKSLAADKITQVFDAAGAVLNCNPSEVLILETHQGTRHGKKARITRFRFLYNPTIYTFLKDAGGAWFDKPTQSWSMIISEESRPRINSELCHYFKSIIDITNLTILRGLTEVVAPSPHRPMFLPIPFHLSVEVDEIRSDLLENKPTPIVNLYAHDGKAFVPLAGIDRFWSQSPFLLLRYSVATERPHYVSYSLLGRSVEALKYGQASALIARYRFTCGATGLDPIILDSSSVIKEQPGMREDYLGPFHFAQVALVVIRTTLVDITFAPLMAHYATFAGQGYGADIDPLTGAVAFVHPWAIHHFRAIAKFFRYPEEAYPIIFNPYLEMFQAETWTVSEVYEVQTTVLHELAHYLVNEVFGRLVSQGDPHGVAWSIINDLLDYAVNEDYCGPSYQAYHPEDKEMASAISSAMAPGFNHIDVVKRCRSGMLPKRDLVTAILKATGSLAKVESSPILPEDLKEFFSSLPSSPKPDTPLKSRRTSL